MKQNYLQTPIFITGIERSGSSIIAKIFNSCGAFLGKTTEMQENKAIRDFVNYFYRQNFWDIKGQFPLPQVQELSIPNKWQSLVNDLVQVDGYQDDRPWVYKSSRIAQIWPIWNFAYPNAKWIIVRRRTGDIVQSCMKTGFMDAYVQPSGWLYWIHEHEKLFVQMIEKGLNCKTIWPERMVNGDFQQMIETLDWVGLKWNPDVLKLVEPLIKSNQKERSK